MVKIKILKDKLLIGNELSCKPGVYETVLPEGKKILICTHDRLNDHGDACLNCGAIRHEDGKWH